MRVLQLNVPVMPVMPVVLVVLAIVNVLRWQVIATWPSPVAQRKQLEFRWAEDELLSHEDPGVMYTINIRKWDNSYGYITYYYPGCYKSGHDEADKQTTREVHMFFNDLQGWNERKLLIRSDGTPVKTIESSKVWRQVTTQFDGRGTKTGAVEELNKWDSGVSDTFVTSYDRWNRSIRTSIIRTRNGGCLSLDYGGEEFVLSGNFYKFGFPLEVDYRTRFFTFDPWYGGRSHWPRRWKRAPCAKPGQPAKVK